MSIKTLGDSLRIRNLTIKNRICVPPMVTFSLNSSEEGMSSDKNVNHYRSIARGGVGLIIQEATCVSPNGKLSQTQLGIWDDAHIEGLSKIVDAVHGEDCHIFVQIHHAGVVGIDENPLCPSAYTLKRKDSEVMGREMSLGDIHTIQNDFILAGKRAFDAGYDGVELHGCHSYLISQFLNKRVNTRQDIYGTDPLRFVTEIVDGIRSETSEDFVIGIRLGGFEPTLEDGIRHAKHLDEHGIDFIDVSYGFYQELDPFKPYDFPLKDVIYAAAVIKKAVSVPVFAVNQIRLPEDAKEVLAVTDVDMVDIGRSILVDYDWANKALSGITPGKCVDCKSCTWRYDHTKCPGRILLQRSSGN